MMKRKLLLICNQNDPWQKTCREIVSSIGELEICSEFEICSLAPEKNYDLVIIDATEIANIARVVTDVLFHLPRSKITVIDALLWWESVRDALVAGADEYASKNSDPEQLLQIFRTVLGS